MTGTIDVRLVIILRNSAGEHPAVVLAMKDGWVWLFPMTGTRREHHAHIAVEMGSREGRAMRLGKDSYFYASAPLWAKQDKVLVSQHGGKCPPGLFVKLRQFAIDALPAQVVVEGQPGLDTTKPSDGSAT